jgi:hypothetical protein
LFTDPSEVKTNVKQPVVDVTLPGEDVPVTVAKGVPVAVLPLYILKMSKLFSRLTEVN